jgi:hypothetical protein
MAGAAVGAGAGSTVDSGAGLGDGSAVTIGDASIPRTTSARATSRTRCLTPPSLIVSGIGGREASRYRY